ncbi:hypothetical protein OPV22_002744 [Ensete ventricosum]|uniref:C3H1-type domain-containing protein n=1 Tax=Ensete ventricosum TaxID=4639 RepID=A0AAV8RYM7_ENSVE|nr:hypothetical protein OPV22_002744 [Ensete ventricosum]
MVRRPMSRSGQGRGAMSSGGGRIPSRPLAANVEALKRNVDCYYFIASPITCTKGSKCEYRHCEGARFNPKDCSYWLKGNCLNRRCTFRHRPLEWLFGNPRVVAVPAEPSSSTAVQVADRPPPNSINKNAITCSFFMKGKCLKGDECPFRHGRRPAGSPLDLHKDQQSSTPPGAIAVKGVEMPPSLEKPIQTEIAGCNPNRQYRFQSMEEALEHFKKAKELKGGRSSRDHTEDSDFFRDVDECAAAWLQGGRSWDFPDHYNDPEPDHQREEMCVRFHGREQQKTTSERTLDRSSMLKKRKLREEESYDELDDEPVARLETDQHRGLHGRDEKLLEEGPSMRKKRKPREESHDDELDPCDLRHQLSKVGRPKAASRAQHYSQSLGRGRAKSFALESIVSATDADRERKRRRLPPARLLMNDQEGYARLHADSSSRARRTSGGQTAGKDVAYPSDFPGRKSLAELKGAKASQTSSHDKKILSSNETADHQEYGSTLSFEGPLPLSVILQRKREAALEKSAISSTEPARLLMNDQEGYARLHADSSSRARRTSGGQTAGKDVAYPSDFPGRKSLAELKGAKASQTSSHDKKILSSNKTADHQEYGSTLSFEGPLPLSVILQRKRKAALEKSAISSTEEGDADDHGRDPAQDGGNVPEASKGTTVDEVEELGRIAKELLDGEDELVSHEAAECEDNEYEVDEDDFANKVGDLLG